MFLTAVKRREGVDTSNFPWTLPVLRGFDELKLTSPVTFLVGENGSGKSTLLEAAAVGMQCVAVGRRDLARDETLAVAKSVADGLRFSRRRHPRTRLFMRAEDVFGFINRISDEMRDLQGIERDVTESLKEGSYARRIAGGTIARQRAALETRYGENPDARSHGETFIELLQQRIVPKGLYFLDEPEAPLSPHRILSLISIIKDAVVEHGSQFIIATHSPILMAVPNAEILHLDESGVRSVDYDEVEHVQFTRSFLNDPNSYLSRL